MEFSHLPVGLGQRQDVLRHKQSILVDWSEGQPKGLPSADYEHGGVQ